MVVCFLILEPTIEYFKERFEKKVLVLAHDVSKSTSSGEDSLFQTIQDDLSVLSNSLEIQKIYFASDVSLDSSEVNDGLTNFSEVKEYLHRNIGLNNLHSIVLVSDGIDNEGEQVDYALDVGVPVHTIAVGDSSQVLDVKIEEVFSNDLVYANQYFPVEIDFASSKKLNKDLRIKLFQNDTLKVDSLISFQKNNRNTCKVSLLAGKQNQQKVKIVLESIEGERNVQNNEKLVLIETINDIQRILVLSETVHPDEAFFIEGLKNNAVFEIERKLYTEAFSIESYNTIVLSGLPSSLREFEALQAQIKSNNLSVLYLPHNSYRISWLNKVFEGKIQLRNELNEISPILVDDFGLFEISEEWKALTNDLSPLNVQLGNLYFKNGENIYNQSVEGIELGLPLVHFESANASYQALFLGEGYWKWRGQSYSRLNSNKYWESFVQKVFKYLNTKKNRKKLQVDYKGQYFENNTVQINALALNELYELDPNVDLVVDLKRDEVSVNSKMTYTSTGYRTDLGYLEKGRYDFEISDKSGKLTESFKGSFTVLENNVELSDKRARYDLLSNLSAKTRGVNLNESAEGFSEVILNSEEVKPVIYSEKVLQSILKFKWLLFVLIGLLFTEWTIRKFKGVL